MRIYYLLVGVPLLLVGLTMIGLWAESCAQRYRDAVTRHRALRKIAEESQKKTDPEISIVVAGPHEDWRAGRVEIAPQKRSGA